MCLMHTDFPVPEGPRIIEICSSGRPRLSPFSTRLRPKALTTSMNSTASSEPWSRFSPVWYWYSSSSWPGSLATRAWPPSSARSRSASRLPAALMLSGSPLPPGSSWYACSLVSAGLSRVSCVDSVSCARVSWVSPSRLSSHERGSIGRSGSSLRCSSATSLSLPTSAAYGRPGIRSPEDLGPDHAHQVDHHRVQHHRLGRGRAHSDRATTRGIPVVAAHEHDHGGHGHALDHAE